MVGVATPCCSCFAFAPLTCDGSFLLSRLSAYLCLGVMKRNAGKFDEAEKWFMEADKNVVSSKISSAGAVMLCVSAAPCTYTNGMSEALTFRGLLYESIGERAKARGVFEKIASSVRVMIDCALPAPSQPRPSPSVPHPQCW